MIADLARRAAPSGRGRLLDLACGTGQLTFPLRDRFTDVWAVDAESGMTEVVRAKAEAVGAAHVRAVTARAEDLDAEPGGFELIVIGNAFHRLNRSLVAQRAYTWLKPGGCLALCWSTSPWAGPGTGSRRSTSCCARGKTPSARPVASRPVGTEHGSRTPTTKYCPCRVRRRRTPRVLGRVPLETIPELAGHIRSTSFLPPSVLADHASEFDADLLAKFGRHTANDRLTETVDFAYELARVSAPA